jgi:hypothetical protein
LKSFIVEALMALIAVKAHVKKTQMMEKYGNSMENV